MRVSFALWLGNGGRLCGAVRCGWPLLHWWLRIPGTWRADAVTATHCWLMCRNGCPTVECLGPTGLQCHTGAPAVPGPYGSTRSTWTIREHPQYLCHTGVPTVPGPFSYGVLTSSPCRAADSARISCSERSRTSRARRVHVTVPRPHRSIETCSGRVRLRARAPLCAAARQCARVASAHQSKSAR